MSCHLHIVVIFKLVCSPVVYSVQCRLHSAKCEFILSQAVSSHNVRDGCVRLFMQAVDLTRDINTEIGNRICVRFKRTAMLKSRHG